MHSVLAIDQSTSATKALLFGPGGEVLGSASKAHRQIYPQPGWVEHDAEEIWSNTLQVISELADRQSTVLSTAACLSLCNQRETVVVFEKGTGKPLYNAMVWQCRRGDTFCRAQADAGRARAIEAKTGLRLDSYFSASKLQWLVRNRPDLQAMMERGDALLGTIDAYLIYRLTGGGVFATDHTNASRTLLYDLDRLGWDEELCAWWEVPKSALPEIRESASVFGETDARGQLSRPLPICGVMGDSQASLLAHRCFEPGQAKATFGTGTSVLLNVGLTRPAEAAGSVLALAWVHEGIPTYALEGIITYSAASLAWLKDQLGLAKDIGELEALASELGDAQGVYLVPAFSGLGAPHWNDEARAAIIGMSAQSDRRHIARAGFDSIAYQLRDVVEMMQAEGGVGLTRLQADGGASNSALLMQFAADLTGVELRVSRNSHCSPLGAALMGWIGMGWRDSFDALPPCRQEEESFKPAMDPGRVAALWAGWQQAVRRVTLAQPAKDATASTPARTPETLPL